MASDTEKNILQEKRVQELEKKMSGLSDYLGQNGQIVVDLVMRVAALEKMLVEKGLLTDEEIQQKVGDTYSELVIKAAKVSQEDV